MFVTYLTSKRLLRKIGKQARQLIQIVYGAQRMKLHQPGLQRLEQLRPEGHHESASDESKVDFVSLFGNECKKGKKSFFKIF